MPDILHQTVIPAVADEIRAALTHATGLAGFWTDQVEAVPEVGSEAWFGFGPGAEVQFRFKVAAIEDRLVEWTCVGGPEEWVGTVVRWRLSAAEGGTLVRLEHRGWHSVEGEFAQCSFVWAQVLARLGEYVGTGRPVPFFRRSA